ncbi:MAG: hypothetical protein ACK4K0_00160 [Flavobacteriales bacterium]
MPEKYHIIEQLILTFEKGDILQIAAVDFDIENDSIKNPNYKQTGEILISIDRIIDIKEADF